MPVELDDVPFSDETDSQKKKTPMTHKMLEGAKPNIVVTIRDVTTRIFTYNGGLMWFTETVRIVPKTRKTLQTPSSYVLGRHTRWRWPYMNNFFAMKPSSPEPKVLRTTISTILA